LRGCVLYFAQTKTEYIIRSIKGRANLENINWESKN